MENPKILVGCPTADIKSYCLDKYAESIKGLTYNNYSMLLVDNSKEDSYSERIKSLGIPVKRSPYREKARDRIVESRNVLREEVLTKGYDFLLSLEQDVIPPKDMIERMLIHEEKVISGVVCGAYGKSNKIRPMIWMDLTEQEYTKLLEQRKKVPKKVNVIESFSPTEIKRNLSLEDVELPQLIDVSITSLSCLLIHRDVLEKVSFRYDPKSVAFDDVWFCSDAKKNGFKVLVDTSIKCKHLLIRPQKWSEIEK